jgi:anti-sigma factor RsiW
MNESCEKFQVMLPDYRWLSPRERAPLDRHVVECARCREEWRDAQAADELFGAARAPAPQGFADAVMSALEPRPQPASARWILAALGSALAAEIAVAVALPINPSPWWRAAVSFGEAAVRDWFAPVTADVMGVFSVAKDWTSPLNAWLLVGALLIVTAFSWFTLNPRRTSHAA